MNAASDATPAPGTEVQEARASAFRGRLLAHFSYHKCLTLYFQRVMQRLATEFGFAWLPFYDDATGFAEAALGRGDARLLVLTDSDTVPWQALPEFRGSHFVRDLRDLVVSGYHYHLWTREAWCTAPGFPWHRYTDRPEFAWVEPDRSQRPTAGSYQSYLQQLGSERGLLMEMLFRTPCIEQLRRWDFGREDILELRYEDVVGNEEAAFSRLFEHYGFTPSAAARGSELVREFRLENQPRRERTHVRSGASGQWRAHFTPRHVDCAKALFGDVLTRLGYEDSDGW